MSTLSAQDNIAHLDAAIDRRGQMVRLIRWSTGPDGARIPFEVKFKANVRELEPGGDSDTLVVISPTALAAVRFPGLPRKDDHLIVHGDDPADIQRIAPIRVDDTLVRVNVTCRG
jgi:hypothetical protein